MNKQIKKEVMFSLYLLVIAIVLAYFEVQIEGANGWASELPTWRIYSPKVTWIFGGRPVTGYHVALNLLLLLFLHWPILFKKWNVIAESEVLAAYAILAVIWDFLWFILNPYFGLGKYNNANVWWFTNWWLGFPVDYYYGLVITLLIRCVPAFFIKNSFKSFLIRGLLFVSFCILGVFIFTLCYTMLSV